MIRFKYSISNFRNFLDELARLINTRVQEGMLIFPPEVGEGYVKTIDLPNGLPALIGDFTLNKDLLIERSKTDKEFYVFVFDKLTASHKAYTDIDNDRVERKNEEVSAMYLLSYLSDLHQFATAGSHLSSIRVIINRDWLARYLKIEQLDEVLQRYLALKARSIHIREVDFESKVLMNEILHPPVVNPMGDTYIQNRIMMLLENFFSWMYDQLSITEMKIRMTRDEIEQIMKVEEALLHNLADAPTIRELSKRAAMSPSKLKKQFKDVYGLPIYEYYQKKRMHKAKELLLEGNRSVKEVGMELGFSNLSNFSLAFKKEHHLLPSELLKTKILN